MSLTNRLLILVFCIIILVSAGATAIRISPSSMHISYEPGKQHEILISVSETEYFDAFIDGELAPYAQLISPAVQNKAPAKVIVKFTEPEGLSAGAHKFFIGAIDSLPSASETQQGFGARAAVKAVIYVDVPYPGVHIGAAINAQDINVGEEEMFTVSVTNKGLEGVSRVSAQVKVLDVDNNTVTELANSEEKPMAAVSSASFEIGWVSEGAKPGVYKAVATVNYDGNSLKTNEAKFKIGSLNVAIQNYTSEFEAGAISPFFIEIESGWNELLQGVYGELIVADKSFKTLTSDLAPWQKIKLTGYIDSNGIAEGGYDAKFIVHYAGQTTEKSARILIAKGPATEMPAGIGTGKITISTIVMIALGVVLVAALIALVIIYAKHNKYTN